MGVSFGRSDSIVGEVNPRRGFGAVFPEKGISEYQRNYTRKEGLHQEERPDDLQQHIKKLEVPAPYPFPVFMSDIR
jgi:hypothetical protein